MNDQPKPPAQPTTVKAEWEGFISQCYRGVLPLPAFQMTELRRAFYGGAMSMYWNIINNVCSLPEAQWEEAMNKLKTEVCEFAAAQMAIAREEMEKKKNSNN